MSRDWLNPFHAEAEPDRHQIWEMLVRRDIEAYVSADWAMVADDFEESSFVALDARGSDDPADWVLAFPRLEAYRDVWLAQAEEGARLPVAEGVDRAGAIFAATSATDIDVRGGRARLRKTFDGSIPLVDGTAVELRWQTVYLLVERGAQWLITGFVGYLPYRS